MLCIYFYKRFIPLLLASLTESNSKDVGSFEVGEQNHGVSHLCINQHWFKNELIVCDIKLTTTFACIGAIEGEIQLCEKSTQNEIFAPVCVQDKTAQLITCKYKNFVSGNLCFPRNTLSSINNEPFKKYNLKPHITFRVCKNKRRFACFNEGDIELCDQLKVKKINYSEIISDEKDCNSFENCKGSNYPEGHKGSKNGYNDQNFEMQSKPQRKSSDIESQNNTLHHLFLGFHETNHARLFKENSQQHLEKTNPSTFQEENSRKTSSDKNKIGLKTSKSRRHKKIEHNCDKGGRDKNTTGGKYRNSRCNNVSSEIKRSVSEKLPTNIAKYENINKYFHILKCEDCQIDNVIKLENDAYNVKMWTLPGN
ncbi:hypothetical protein JTE90_022402 [Oedothorax gibbosus]|uniref:Uncharacterized protein n=1 Tax=Oedothorax gibbosus TaxID=931172 RepID=A0AAV6TZV7_9ARAC|nr:hypothetical protein JTE90_022402 [Oedothorax gibbosus]